ncbi:Iron-sulfur cluster-binding protein, RIESKE family OS=Streptomyces antimycoticus OX=68175 GN=SANT12839_007100 PE=4 SV=1 [Streptomyces antimycoticus]
MDAYFVQFSGVIWYPMVYELPVSPNKEFATRGRSRPALRLSDAVDAKHVFPNGARPPSSTTSSSSTTAKPAAGRASSRTSWSSARGAGAPGGEARLCLPGTVAEPEDTACKLTYCYTESEIEHIFAQKCAHCGTSPGPARALAAERASPAPALPRERLWQLKQRRTLSTGPTGSARASAAAPADVGEVPIVIDFPAREVRLGNGERCRYTRPTWWPPTSSGARWTGPAAAAVDAVHRQPDRLQ